ncbi:MAG: cysteine dioxygenase family protein, partial [Rhodospirillaceae bacterium]|nr:cysteine dioxygenase family protein [Rhodospirillaceae bacterium]
MTHAAVSYLVTQLKSIAAEETDPAAIVARVEPLAAQMAADTSWMRPEFYETDAEQGMGINILHEEEDVTILVEVISWAPGQGVAPHDHQTWGVVVGIDGVEVNVDWRRLDDGSKPGFADLEKARELHVKKGDVVALLPDDIHSVRNDGDTPSVSLHMYGRVLAKTARSEF